MLSGNDTKEELSIAYIHAVASREGFSVELIRKDRDSVDMKICGRGRLSADATLESPEVAVQVKATSTVEIDTDEFSFVLKRKNYDDLIKTTLVPRILVVFVMPQEREKWVEWTEESLLLRRCAYWTCLRGQKATDNDTSQTVLLRRADVFDPTAIRKILLHIAREQDLSSAGKS
ncbi:MAG: DUF4365 domain-containing protein [Polyangia bacterium]